MTVTVNAVSTEVVIDNGGPGTSYTGTWEVSGATGFCLCVPHASNWP